MQKDRGAREKLGSLFGPEHDVIPVKRAEAYVFALAFAVGAHMQVHEVVSQRVIEIVHRGKIKGGLGFIAVAEYHRNAGIALAAQEVGVKLKPVGRAYHQLFKGQGPEGLKVGDVVLPERLPRRREQG